MFENRSADFPAATVRQHPAHYTPCNLFSLVWPPIMNGLVTPVFLVGIMAHVTTSGSFSIALGTATSAKFQLRPEQILGVHLPPSPLEDLAKQIRQTLEHPPGFPPLRSCVVPGDRVCVVLDDGLLHADLFASEIISILKQSHVEPRDITVISRISLPAIQAEKITTAHADVPLTAHTEPGEAVDEAQCAYLASSADGQRVYLSRPIIDADFVISCGLMTYHPQTGYRTTSTMIFPELSDEQALARYQTWSTDELDPEDDRQWRQLASEVDWLIGSPFSIQAIPSSTGGISDLSAGQAEQTFSALRPLMDEGWRFRIPQRVALVVAIVDLDSQDTSFSHVAQALKNARKLVEREGKIVLVTTLNAPLSEHLDILRRHDTPYEAFQTLRQLPAQNEASHALIVAETVDWASVYLMSGLPSDVVEDLFMTPIQGNAELQRLLEAHPDETTCVLIGAQYVWAEVGLPAKKSN